MRTVSIDPGKRCMGASLFAGTRLIAAALSNLPDGFYKTGQVAAFHAQTVRPWGPVDRVVCEEMQLSLGRDGRNSSRIVAVANDLLVLTSVGAYVAGKLGAALDYVPVPKHDKIVGRSRVLATLQPDELAVLDAAFGGAKWRTAKTGLWMNGTDAVLHGLRAVGRYG